jgi:quercetin dioxygenase-like cupin family protein
LGDTSPHVGRLDEMVAQGLRAFQPDGELPSFPVLDDGRAKAVFVSPDDGSSSDLVVNALVLPPGFLNPAHSHVPEELLIVLHGSGTVTIDEGAPMGITEGDFVVLPPVLSHSLEASADASLLLLTVMAKTQSDSDNLNVG